MGNTNIWVLVRVCIQIEFLSSIHFTRSILKTKSSPTKIPAYKESWESIPHPSPLTPPQKKKQESFTSWWFQPIWKIKILVQIRVKIKSLWNHHLDTGSHGDFFSELSGDAPRIAAITAINLACQHRKNPFDGSRVGAVTKHGYLGCSGTEVRINA